jgi:8-oxo-dGTP diphosphatase
MSAVIACAGGIVFDGDGRLLVVRRARPPGQGLWSVPGGKCLPGEPPREACVREVAEETGLAIVVYRFAGRVQRPALEGTYVIDDFVCGVRADDDGQLRAGDDASEARWVDAAQLADLPLVPLLAETLGGWGLLPR